MCGMLVLRVLASLEQGGLDLYGLLANVIAPLPHSTNIKTCQTSLVCDDKRTQFKHQTWQHHLHLSAIPSDLILTLLFVTAVCAAVELYSSPEIKSQPITTRYSIYLAQAHNLMRSLNANDLYF